MQLKQALLCSLAAAALVPRPTFAQDDADAPTVLDPADLPVGDGTPYDEVDGDDEMYTDAMTAPGYEEDGTLSTDEPVMDEAEDDMYEVADGPVADDSPVPSQVPTTTTTAGPVSALWPQCLERLTATSNETDPTHSLQDILDSPSVSSDTAGSFPMDESPVFQQIVDLVDAQTEAIINEFDLTTEGYTLIVPRDGALVVDPATNGTTEVSIFEAFNVTIADLSEADATAIVQSHLIEGTLTFNSLIEATADNASLVVPALNGFEWTFESRTDGNGGMFPVLVDEFGLTTEGQFFIQADKTATDAGVCPNAVITVGGILATPAVAGDRIPLAPVTALAPGAAAPAPAPAPAAAMAPRAADGTADATAGDAGTSTSGAAGTSTATPTASNMTASAYGAQALVAFAGAVAFSAVLV